MIQKNNEGFIIEQLAEICRLVSNENENLSLVDPVNWISAWMVYCADKLDIDYPTFDMNQVIEMLLLKMHEGF